MRKRSAHYISGTHWDREWYRPFQEFRYLLVRLLDDLIDLMERDAEFRYFQLDGQTCVLEDYLEIRPENRSRLQALIGQGRILIGPWFTMPDLFCVGDEAMVRNLLVGQRISRSWGVEPMKIGFVCDMFGHPSQMPQIFAGFGCQEVVLGRGTNESTTPPLFEWEASDGSRCLVFKLQDKEGYGAFAYPRAALSEEKMFFSGMMEDFWKDLEAAGSDPVAQSEARHRHFRLELAKYVEHEDRRTPEGVPLCLIDSMDHIAPATEVGRYLSLIRETAPGLAPKHSTLAAFFEEVRRTCANLCVRRGELREPSREKSNYLLLIPNTTSSRVRMKQNNDQCQTLLERWADSFVAIANEEGANVPLGHLEVAWKHLLLNHAHDSICGCSIDQVHRDMLYRFDQVRELGSQLRNQSVGFLTSQCRDLAQEADDFTLTVINPLPQARDEVVVFDVDLPADYPTQFIEGLFSQNVKSFVFEDEQGHVVPYQRLGFTPLTNERSRYARFCFQSDGPFMRYTVAARLALPGLGFTSLRVRPSARPVRCMGSLRTGPVSARNEYLAMEISSNGTLTLVDLETGQAYRDLLLFADSTEVADGWFHARSVNDAEILSTACHAQIAVEHDGPELVTFRIQVRMDVPVRLDQVSQAPSVEQVPLVITSRVRLRKGARVVELEVSIDNTAEDHRLQMLFPTDCTEASHWLSHQPFDFIERSIALDPSTVDWQEMEIPEKPFLGMLSTGQKGRGLVLISAAGIHEGGLRDDWRRTLFVTLLRSFRRTIATGGEPDGLEKGLTSLRFALMPHTGELPRACAMSELFRLQAGLITRQTGKRPSGYPEMVGELSPNRGFIECLDSRLAVSAIKTAESGKGLVIRLWNPTQETARERIQFWKPIGEACYMTLGEECLQPVTERDGNLVTVEARGGQIITIHVLLAEADGGC